MKISIKYKFALGFLIIFAGASLCLYYFTSNMLYKNSTDIITADMQNIQYNSREYVKKVFKPSGENTGHTLFATNGKALARELSKNHQCNVTLYDTQGNFLYQSIQENEQLFLINTESNTLNEKKARDLQLALDNKAAFTFEHINEQVWVNFSFPLYINNHHYGIIRFSKDYTHLYQFNQQLLNAFTFFIITLFGGLFVFSNFLTNKIISPLTKLAYAFKKVGGGHYTTTLMVTGNDEITELTKSFNLMSSKIKQQVETIEAEKQKIIKLEQTKTEFFQNVTHELKTPLTTISGYAQIIGAEDFNDQEFLFRAAGRIKSESDRLHQMVVQLLEFSKQHSYQVETTMSAVDFKKILTTIGTDMSLKAAKYNMTIEQDLQPAMVRGNPNQLKELVINLLDNAIKYGHVNSIIGIQLRQQHGYSHLVISNQCDPIPTALQHNLFEPFHKGSAGNEQNSSGLGLYICQTIVQHHSGTMAIKNQAGVTHVTVKIPLWQQVGNNQ